MQREWAAVFAAHFSWSLGSAIKLEQGVLFCERCEQADSRVLPVEGQGTVCKVPLSNCKT